MPLPAINYQTYINRIPTHVEQLSDDATVPILHYRRHANDAWNLLLYFKRQLKRTNVYNAASNRHMQHLRVMTFLSLVESFERLLKELAANCIDQVGGLVLDDRLNVFTLKGDAFASQYSGGGSLGKTLCDPVTWCDCDSANDRFRRILAKPYHKGDFYVFPRAGQQPKQLRDKYELMSVIWQLRHSIVHNCGVLTTSDAHKLRVLCKSIVVGDRHFSPTHGDVWYVKLFLDETAENINAEVTCKLADLLTSLYSSDPTLFDPDSKVKQVAEIFGVTSTVAGHTCSVP